MTFENRRFDYILGSSVLHHLDIEKAISEIYRVLKDGGIIAFTEPNMMNPQIALQKNIPYLKRKLGDSPDETVFFRWKISKLLKK
jgi:ubiquinone/menaquinone biosynthesis C-methylase UbiE